MSEEYLCLNCWRTSPREALFYRCDACAGARVPGWLQRPGAAAGAGEGLRRVADLRRPWYRRLLTDGGAETRCPRHPHSVLKLFCECCYPLTERAAIPPGGPLAVGIAGPRSAGKTLFLVTLMHELRRLEIGRRKLGLVGLDDTEARFHDLSAGFFDHGEKPGATRPASPEAADWQGGGLNHPNFGWTLTVDGAGRRPPPPVLIVAGDVGGETWSLPGHQRQALFDRYLDLVGSLIFLIDGMALAADLGLETRDAWDASPPSGDRGAETRQHFSRVVERLGERARRTDLAVVVSKADVLWQHGALPPPGKKADGKKGKKKGRRRSADDNAAAVEKVLFAARRRDVVVEARRRFRSVGLFAASSLGFLPGDGDVDPAGRLRRPSRPRGVTEPLVSLLAKRLPALRR